MDGKIRWADNIMIERWFRSFKYEEAYLTQYNNIKEVRAAIGQYIHTYNFERRHSALDYQTPDECYYPAMLLPYVAQHKWFRGELHYEDALKAYDVLEDMAEKIRKYVNNGPAQRFAETHKNEDVIYVMGGAPAMGVSYATSICSLMEIQWIHSPTVNSAEFFHGPFETLDRNLPMVHLVSDGRSREEDLRCQRFMEKFGEKVTTIDAKELGIDILGDNVKEYFNHVFLDCAWREYLTALAIERKHPKEVRRYMWKMEY